MSSRFAFLALSAILAVLGGQVTTCLAAPPSSTTGDEARIGQILEEWQRRSSQWTSLDVDFDRTTDQVAWGARKQHKGRAVLIRGGAAVVELVKVEESGKESETMRLLWRDGEFHQIQPGQKQRTTWPIAEPDRGRLPAMLALPFCWQTNVETLRSHYRISLMREDPETWSLQFTPIGKAGKSEASRFYLKLDRRTCLPRRFIRLSPDGAAVEDYRITKAQVNEPARPEFLEVPQGEGWEVNRAEEHLGFWVLRLLKPDLLP
ncbi:MAG: hypothetical protein U0790_01450 [Isosphaeraceae bacterium]